MRKRKRKATPNEGQTDRYTDRERDKQVGRQAVQMGSSA